VDSRHPAAWGEQDEREPGRRRDESENGLPAHFLFEPTVRLGLFNLFIRSSMRQAFSSLAPGAGEFPRLH
jgi:hypothetical protein